MSILIKETDIQKSVCQFLEYKKMCFWRSNNIPAFSWNLDGSIRMRKMPRYTPKGVPDIILIFKGIFVGLEIKKEKRYQSPDQKRMEKWIKENQGEYFVVRSLDDIQKIVLDLDEKYGNVA